MLRDVYQKLYYSQPLKRSHIEWTHVNGIRSRGVVLVLQGSHPTNAHFDWLFKPRDNFTPMRMLQNVNLGQGGSVPAKAFSRFAISIRRKMWTHNLTWRRWWRKSRSKQLTSFNYAHYPPPLPPTTTTTQLPRPRAKPPSLGIRAACS